ncbi:hypothetical protein 7908G4G3_42 [Haloquadratum phage sp.]|nr:hypothetical protein 7908G4G3_42 [Haloquadratum phage sp.]
MGDHTQKQWLQKQYCESDRTQKDIAEEQGVSQAAISRWVCEFNLSDEAEHNHEPLNEDWLREQYVHKQKSLQQIADENDFSRDKVRVAILESDVEMRDQVAAHRLSRSGHIEPDHQDEEWLQEQYCELDRTQQEIAEVADVHPTTITTWLQRHGITTESSGSANILDEIRTVRDR